MQSPSSISSEGAVPRSPRHAHDAWRRWLAGAAVAFVVVTATEFVLMTMAGFAGGCDKLDKGPGRLATEYCAQYADGWLDTPTFGELATFIGPSVLILAGIAAAQLVRVSSRTRAVAFVLLAVTSVLAVTWGVATWLPVVAR